MNVIDILHELGYDVVSFDGEGHYKVLINRKKREAMKQSGDTYTYNLMDTFEIYVEEVEFNGLGDLCVTFKEVGTEEENICFDVYEYRNND